LRYRLDGAARTRDRVEHNAAIAASARPARTKGGGACWASARGTLKCVSPRSNTGTFAAGPRGCSSGVR